MHMYTSRNKKKALHTNEDMQHTITVPMDFDFVYLLTGLVVVGSEAVFHYNLLAILQYIIYLLMVFRDKRFRCFAWNCAAYIWKSMASCNV